MGKWNTIDRYAARLLMLSFFLPMYWQVQVTGILCLYFVFRVVVTKSLVPRANYGWAFFLGSIFLLYFFSALLTPPEFRTAAWHQCEHRVALFFMPIVFAIVSPRYRSLFVSEVMYFAYGCFIICATANADFAYHYFFVKGDHTLTHVYYRTVIHLFTDTHPTYLSMYLCFSICIMLLAPRLGINVHPAIINTLLFISFFFLLALGAKTPIAAMVLIIIHYAWTHRRDMRRYRWVFSGLLVTFIASWFFVPFLRQRMGELVQFYERKPDQTIVDNSVVARKMIWDIDSDLLKRYWLSGIGPANINAAVEHQSYVHSLTTGVPVLYHDPHNEYFYEWICFGIIGIGLLVAILFVQFRRAIKGKDHLYLYLLIILSATFFTESVLSLQRGVVFYAVMTSMLFFGEISKSSDSMTRTGVMSVTE